MRKDMNKVVTEAVRHGGTGKIKNKFDRVTKPREKRTISGVPVDLSPKRESMRKRHVVNENYKTPSDLLGPLQRFLISKVGQPWSEVWSEICKVFKADGWQANHIKDHIKDFVGGTTHSGKCNTFSRYGILNDTKYDLVYVDANGILQKGELYGKRWKSKSPKKVFPYVIESDTVEYHKIHGCWYRMVGEKYTYTYIVIDRFTKKPVERKEEVHSLTKRALSRKEAKKLNLVNRLSTKPSKFFKME